jgi:hypothetical protein
MGDTADALKQQGKVAGALGCGAGCGLAGVGLATVFVIALVAGLGQIGGCDWQAGPGEGKASRRLEITVAPSTGLHDGSPVFVTSEAFHARRIVGLVVCLRTVDTQNAGVGACDRTQGARYSVDRKGRLAVAYAVPRWIRTTSGVHDCANAPGACVLVAADVGDFDESGGRPLSFAAGGDRRMPPTERSATDRLPIAEAPGAGTADGTVHHLTASGFQPGEPLLVARCLRSFATGGPVGRCEPLDRRAAYDALTSGLAPTDPKAGPDGRFSADLTATAWILPFPAVDPGTLGDPVDVALQALNELADPPADHSPGAKRPVGAVDCAVEPGTCVFVIAAAADSKRSAILPYTVTAGG